MASWWIYCCGFIDFQDYDAEICHHNSNLKQFNFSFFQKQIKLEEVSKVYLILNVYFTKYLQIIKKEPVPTLYPTLYQLSQPSDSQNIT